MKEKDEFIIELINYLRTKVFVEQPLASPGSTDNHIGNSFQDKNLENCYHVKCNIYDCFGEKRDWNRPGGGKIKLELSF